MTSNLHRKHQEVQVWLEKLHGDRTVPAYELNDYTVGILHDLMCRNERKEQEAKLLIEDLKQKAQEYRAESSRTGGILQKVNLVPANLSKSGQTSLRTLSSLALTLGTRDASDTSYLLAMQQLEDETMKAEESSEEQQRELNILTEKVKAVVLKHAALQRALDDLNKKRQVERPVVEKNATQTKFIRAKAKEYKTRVQQLEASKVKVGAEPEIYHQELLNRAGDLEKLKKEIIPMKVQLDSYHGLPPNAVQAHMQLDEIKEKVAKLEEELAKKIDLMQL